VAGGRLPQARRGTRHAKWMARDTPLLRRGSGVPEDAAKKCVGEVRSEEEEGVRDERRGRVPARAGSDSGSVDGSSGSVRVRVPVSPWGPFGPRGCCEVSYTPRGRRKTRRGTIRRRDMCKLRGYAVCLPCQAGGCCEKEWETGAQMRGGSWLTYTRRRTFMAALRTLRPAWPQYPPSQRISVLLSKPRLYEYG
jgi:hypothetical protein